MKPSNALTIAFVVLKLCEVIDWSWWWVTSPIWIALILDGIANGLIAAGKKLNPPKTPREEAVELCKRISKELQKRN